MKIKNIEDFLTYIPDGFIYSYDNLSTLVIKYQERTIMYQERIYKAIEYINVELFGSNIEWVRNNNGCVTGSDLPGDAIFPIIDILQGKDN